MHRLRLAVADGPAETGQDWLCRSRASATNELLVGHAIVVAMTCDHRVSQSVRKVYQAHGVEATPQLADGELQLVWGLPDVLMVT